MLITCVIWKQVNYEFLCKYVFGAPQSVYVEFVLNEVLQKH